jgi:GNAT superfamily N-acetyltransferase
VPSGCGNIDSVKSLVRPARPEDKDAIVAFCQNTFDWGDYIANVWDDWLADRKDGILLVAIAEERPVGLVHVLLLPERVAWMEGMRVHPDYRHVGIGGRLDRAAREHARERGSLVARLATSINNIPAQSVLGREGYTPVAQFDSWIASPAGEASPQWRVARRADLSLLLGLWARSPGDKAGHGILPTPRWTWTEVTESRLRDEIDQGQVRIGDDGFAIVSAEDGEEWSALNVYALVGEDDALAGLARDSLAEARYRGFPRVEAMVANDRGLSDALERAGLTRQGAMLIYEHVL